MEREVTGTMRTDRRILILAGHNGSGKTLLAVNLALALRAAIPGTVIATDMDTVKPYFRMVDAEEELKAAGIRVIAPELVHSTVDLPTLPGEMRAMFDEPDAHSVLDVGGDDAGAIALGQYEAEFARVGYELLLVVNPYRMFTRTPEDAMKILRDIEHVSHLRFTGIVHNPNLGGDTTEQTLLDAAPYAKSLAALSGLPIRATAYLETLTPPAEAVFGEAWPIRMFRKKEWVFYDV